MLILTLFKCNEFAEPVAATSKAHSTLGCKGGKSKETFVHFTGSRIDLCLFLFTFYCPEVYLSTNWAVSVRVLFILCTENAFKDIRCCLVNIIGQSKDYANDFMTANFCSL